MLETTITVVFNGGTTSTDYLILAELDDVLNVDSSGEAVSSFYPGYEPYLRFNSSTNIRLDEVVATSGGILDYGTATRTLDIEQLFASRDTEEPSELTFTVVPNNVSVSYVGNTGRFTTESLTFGRLKYIGDTNYTPFLMAAEVNYTARIFQLIPPGLSLGEDETYNIHIVFYVTLLEA